MDKEKSDFSHINVSELDAVVKGINLVIKWGLSVITVVTDSATVYGWLNLVMNGDRNVRTKGAPELL